MVPIRRPPATPVAYPSRQAAQLPRATGGPTGWKVISVLDTAYHPNIEADDVDDYNETYIINSELWSMIRDHKEMRAKYKFKSQQPAPMDESA